MSETRAFPTADVLTAVTGRLMGKIGGLYELLNWMTGESIYTHQLGRVSKEATPVLIERHPTLALAVEEASQVTTQNWETYRDRWLERYGPEIEVPRLTEDQHERIDPLSELAEKVHPDKIKVVEL